MASVAAAAAAPPRRPSTAGSSASFKTARSNAADFSSPRNYARFVPGPFFTSYSPDSPSSPDLAINSPPDVSSPSHATATTTTTDDDTLSSSLNRSKFTFPNPSDSSTLPSGVSTPPSSASTPQPMADQPDDPSLLPSSSFRFTHPRHHSALDPPSRPVSCDAFDSSTPSRLCTFTPGASSLSSAFHNSPVARRTPSLRHVPKKPELRTVSAPLREVYDAGDSGGGGGGGVKLSYIPPGSASHQNAPIRAPSAPVRDSLAPQTMRVHQSRPAAASSSIADRTQTNPCPPGDSSIARAGRDYHQLKTRSFTAPSSRNHAVFSFEGPALDGPQSTKPLQLPPLVLESELHRPAASASPSPISPCPTSNWPSVRTAVRKLEVQRGSRPKRHSFDSGFLPPLPEHSQPPPKREPKSDSAKRRHSFDPTGALLQSRAPISVALPSVSDRNAAVTKRESGQEGNKKRDSVANNGLLQVPGSDVNPSNCTNTSPHKGRTSRRDGSDKFSSVDMLTQLSKVQAAVSMAERSAEEFVESGVRLHPSRTEMKSGLVTQTGEDGITTHFHHYHHYHHHHHHHHIVSQSSLRHVASDASSRAEVGHAVAVPLQHLTPPQTGNPPSERKSSSLRDESLPGSDEEQFFDVQSIADSSDDDLDLDVEPSSSTQAGRAPVPTDVNVTSFDPAQGPAVKTGLTVSNQKGTTQTKDTPLPAGRSILEATHATPRVTLIPPTPHPSVDGVTTDTAASSRTPTPYRTLPSIVVPGPASEIKTKKGPTLAGKVRRYSDSLARAIHPATAAIEKRLFTGKVRDRVVQVKNRALRKGRSSSHGSVISQDSTNTRDVHLHPEWIPRSERDRLAHMGLATDYYLDTDQEAWTLPPGGDTSDVEDEGPDRSRLRAWSGKVKLALFGGKKDRDCEPVARLEVREVLSPVTDGVPLPKAEPVIDPVAAHKPAEIETTDHGVSLSVGSNTDAPVNAAENAGEETDDETGEQVEEDEEEEEEEEALEEEVDHHYNPRPSCDHFRDPHRAPRPEPCVLPTLVAPSNSFYSHDNTSSTHANLIFAPNSYSGEPDEEICRTGRRADALDEDRDGWRPRRGARDVDYYGSMGVSLHTGNPPSPPYEDRLMPSSVYREDFGRFQYQPSPSLVSASLSSDPAPPAPAAPAPRTASAAPGPPQSTTSSAIVVPWGESPAKPPPAPAAPGPRKPPVSVSASAVVVPWGESPAKPPTAPPAPGSVKPVLNRDFAPPGPVPGGFATSSCPSPATSGSGIPLATTSLSPRVTPLIPTAAASLSPRVTPMIATAAASLSPRVTPLIPSAAASLSPRVTPLIATAAASVAAAVTTAPVAPTPSSAAAASSGVPHHQFGAPTAPAPPSVSRSAPTPTGSYKLRPRHPPSAFVTRGFADSISGSGGGGGGGGYGYNLEPEPEELDPWLAISYGVDGLGPERLSGSGAGGGSTGPSSGVVPGYESSAFESSHHHHPHSSHHTIHALSTGATTMVGPSSSSASSAMPIFGDEVLVGDGFSPFGEDSIFSDRSRHHALMGGGGVGSGGGGGYHPGFGFGMYDHDGGAAGFDGFSSRTPESDGFEDEIRHSGGAGGVAVA